MATIHALKPDWPCCVGRRAVVSALCLTCSCVLVGCDYVRALFAGSPPEVTVTVPNGGEQWKIGSAQLIEWVNTGGADAVDSIWRSKADSSWVLVAAVNGPAANYSWTVPDDPTTTASVKVVAHNAGGSSGDQSDHFFTLFQVQVDSPPIVKVSTPNGGEEWEAGTSHLVEWSNAGGADVIDSLWYCTSNDTWTFMAAVSGPRTSYDWRVPDDPTAAAKVKVVARNAGGSGSDQSDEVFTIVGSYILTRISSLSVGCAYDLKVSEGYVYVAENAGALVVVNAANPSAPYEVGRLALGEQIQVICVQDGLAFLGDWASELLIVDIHDPANPRLLSKLRLTQGASIVQGVVVDSQYAYCTANGRLHVVDVTDPSAPHKIAEVNPQEGALWQVVKENGYIYAMGYTGLSTFAVADPHAPVHLGVLRLSGIYDILGPHFHGVVAGGHLFMSAGDLLEIDISNPAEPTVASTITDGWYVCGVAAQDSILCYGYGEVLPGDSLSIHASFAGRNVSAGVAGPCLSVAIAGNHLFAALENSGMAVYELARRE